MEHLSKVFAIVISCTLLPLQVWGAKQKNPISDFDTDRVKNIGEILSAVKIASAPTPIQIKISYINSKSNRRIEHTMPRQFELDTFIKSIESIPIQREGVSLSWAVSIKKLSPEDTVFRFFGTHHRKIPRFEHLVPELHESFRLLIRCRNNQVQSITITSPAEVRIGQVRANNDSPICQQIKKAETYKNMESFGIRPEHFADGAYNK